jgi:hypothetical protein
MSGFRNMPLRKVSREGKSGLCDLADVYGNPDPGRSLTVQTTFVAGMFNKFAQETARLFFWIHDSWSEHRTIKHHRQKSQPAQRIS